MGMKQASQQFPDTIIEYDLNKTAFFEHNELHSEIIPDNSGRVGFRVPANSLYFRLADQWNKNTPVPCLDFANEIRKLRARMLAAKTENGQRGIHNDKRPISQS
jgi:hypothetical protein